MPGTAVAAASVALREVDVMRSNATYAVAVLGMASMAVPLAALRAVGYLAPPVALAVLMACGFAMSVAMLALTVGKRADSLNRRGPGGPGATPRSPGPP